MNPAELFHPEAYKIYQDRLQQVEENENPGKDVPSKESDTSAAFSPYSPTASRASQVNLSDDSAESQREKSIFSKIPSFNIFSKSKQDTSP